MSQTWEARDPLAQQALEGLEAASRQVTYDKHMSDVLDAVDHHRALVEELDGVTDWAAEEDAVDDRCLYCDQPIPTWHKWFDQECPKAPLDQVSGCPGSHEVGPEQWRVICADGAKTTPLNLEE